MKTVNWKLIRFSAAAYFNFPRDESVVSWFSDTSRICASEIKIKNNLLENGFQRSILVKLAGREQRQLLEEKHQNFLLCWKSFTEMLIAGKIFFSRTHTHCVHALASVNLKWLRRYKRIFLFVSYLSDLPFHLILLSALIVFVNVPTDKSL